MASQPTLLLSALSPKRKTKRKEGRERERPAANASRVSRSPLFFWRRRYATKSFICRRRRPQLPLPPILPSMPHITSFPCPSRIPKEARSEERGRFIREARKGRREGRKGTETLAKFNACVNEGAEGRSGAERPESLARGDCVSCYNSFFRTAFVCLARSLVTRRKSWTPVV